MTKRNTVRKAALATLALAGLYGPSNIPVAYGQAATDVECVQCVGKGDIVDKSITAVKIHSNSIFSPKIIDRSIQGVDIGVGEIGTDEIADGGVTGADIADETITAGDIAADAVGRDEIAADAVGPAEIIDGAVTGADIRDGGVTGADIADGSVSTSKIAPGAVTGNKIAAGAVDAQRIALNAVTGAAVADDSLSAVDLSNEAGLDSAGSFLSNLLTTDAAIVRSVTLTAPATGQVMVMASGSFLRYLENEPSFPHCSITTGTIVDTQADFFAHVTDTQRQVPFAGVRTFAASAGSTTYNLVCKVQSNSIGNAWVLNGQIAAMYVPTVY